MAIVPIAKLAAAILLLIIIIIILPCVLPSSASRLAAAVSRQSEVDEDHAPISVRYTEKLASGTGVVMVSNNTARVQDDCSELCNDKRCQDAFPHQCGDHPEPNHCWVGCLCSVNLCTCLCTE